MLGRTTALLFSLRCWGENLVGRAGVLVSCRQGSGSLEEKSSEGVRLGSSFKSLLRILRFVGICRLLCVSTLLGSDTGYKLGLEDTDRQNICCLLI